MAASAADSSTGVMVAVMTVPLSMPVMFISLSDLATSMAQISSVCGGWSPSRPVYVSLSRDISTKEF